MLKFEFPFGADITGYVRADGFCPSLAVLCPRCAAGLNGDYWRQQAELGEALDARGFESLGQYGARCEGCGVAACEWSELV